MRSFGMGCLFGFPSKYSNANHTNLNPNPNPNPNLNPNPNPNRMNTRAKMRLYTNPTLTP
eukprot:1055466-Amorphochlora_amoeboformis.AAC.1